jgi:hypothetical protein
VHSIFLTQRSRDESKLVGGAPAGLLATIKSQQAVAKRFCWKARQSFDVPFF